MALATRAFALLAVLPLVLAGCATSRPVRVPAAAKLCGPDLQGAEPLFAPGSIVLLGEMHGTNEIPFFASELACQATAQGIPVTVGIEAGVSEQPLFDAFLASEGSEDDRRRLTNGAFWNRPYQDGRSSLAMLALLERLRELRKTGVPVRALAYDEPSAEHNVHSEAMAKHVLDARAGHEGELFLVLCGNVHARTVPGVEWDREFVPMGARLKAAVPGLKSLDADYAAGAAWTCRLPVPIDCGVTSVLAPKRVPDVAMQPAGTTPPLDPMFSQGNEIYPTPSIGFRGYRPFVRLFSRASPEGYDGLFYVGPITASTPVKPAALGLE